MDILHRVGMKSSPEAVYGALSTIEGLASWWTVDTRGNTGIGDVIKFTFTADGRELGFFDMKVLELDPGKRVLWQVDGGPAEWVGTRVHWDLKQEDGFTIILFRHEGWREPVEFMSHCSTKWATFLMSLKALLETGKGSPSPNDVRIGNWH